MVYWVQEVISRNLADLIVWLDFKHLKSFHHYFETIASTLKNVTYSHNLTYSRNLLVSDTIYLVSDTNI